MLLSCSEKTMVIDLKEYFFSNCSFCNAKIGFLQDICEQCKDKIDNFSKSRRCVVCNRPILGEDKLCCRFCEKITPQFDQAIACCNYEGEFKNALRGYKFNYEFFRVKLFAKILVQQFYKLNVKCDVIVPVPTSNKNILKRRYCDTFEIAKLMNKKLKIKLYPKALVKMKDRQQSSLKLEERYKNVKGAFEVDTFYKNKFKGKNVLLVDDVITTGATASECAELLKKNGAKEVYLTALLYGGGN